MLKFFLTGDNHFGKKYDRYPEIKELLINSRFECLAKMITKAEIEGCQLFVIAGDLFDNINTVSVSDVKKVVDIISEFSGAVLVLPGNHDYYTGDEKVWKDFEKALSKTDHNIIILNEFRKYSLEIEGKAVVIYPAFCQSKHSKSNNLAWIKESDIDRNVINIGIAHGAIEGITPDINGEYFLMSESELSAIPMDSWLIGHTHTPYPAILSDDKDTSGYSIFNAGTHAQTDLHNNTEGNGFVISIDKSDQIAKVCAKKYVSGEIRFFDISISVNSQNDTALRDAINKALEGISDKSVIRINVSGCIKQSEYLYKDKLYKDVCGRFLTYEINDDELSEEITVDKIRDEYAQTSFAARFLEGLIDNPTELQMTYQLLENCKE